MKTQWKGYQPETRYGQPAAPQVGNDDASLSHPVHLAHELKRVGAREMMEDLRGNDEIERARRKGERQRVADDTAHRPFPRRPDEFQAVVQAEHAKFDTVGAGAPAQSIRDVACAGTNIEQGDHASAGW